MEWINLDETKHKNDKKNYNKQANHINNYHNISLNFHSIKTKFRMILLIHRQKHINKIVKKENGGSVKIHMSGIGHERPTIETSAVEPRM